MSNSVMKRWFVFAFGLVAACGSDPVDKNIDPAQGDGGVVDASVDGGASDAASDAARPRDAASTRDARAPQGSLSIAPSGTLTIDGSSPQSVTFTARLPDGSASNVPVTWAVSPRELGSIDASSGAFTPSGAGGSIRVTARAGSEFGEITVVLVARSTQEGDPDFGKVPAGAGGVGGVGGEGGGATLSDPKLRGALDQPPADDASLQWLYPYDGTVWPRGLPAPLLQWRYGDHPPAAVKLTVEVDDTFSATLYLGPPMGVTQIDRLPIPQAVWRNALLSGTTMKVTLAYASSDGSGGFKAYKATKPLTWTIAPTTLKGVVYYNSYGTKLAENFNGAIGGNGRFGGATLAIQGGAFDPTLAAGSTTQDSTGCRVCHSVSADGSTLIAQADNGHSSIYDLRTAKETVVPPADDYKFGWAALAPNGSYAFGASGPPGVAGGVSTHASLDVSAFYRVPDASALTASGLSIVSQAATPSFSPDGKKVAFNLWKGTGFGAVKGDGKSLVVMDVDKPDPNTVNLTNPVGIYTSSNDSLPAWPFFLPDNSGVIYELELARSRYGELFMTRDDARGELWWTDLNGNAHALDAANGKGYIPTGAAQHDHDETLQYEPTVAPIVAGGYAWVVFTSRRLYGNVATRPPFESDPRNVDLNVGNGSGPTTKKLWVSAISLPPKPGTDPSHPAFYLPAQELYAGNSRGFWALEACKADGQRCEGGDQCCNGFCTQSLEFPVCGVRPPDACAAEYDSCNVSADCCDATPRLTCVAGRCAQTTFL